MRAYMVRAAAVNALASDKALLAKHEEAIVKKLDDGESYVCAVVLYICLWRQKWSAHVFVHVRTNMKCSGTQPALASEKRCSGASRSKSLVYTYRFQRSLYE